VGVAVQSIQLTDDDLWRAIANNTNALSALIEQQSELDAGTAESSLDPDTRQQLLLFNVQAIDKYHREYRDFVAEVCRRYPSI
jgi:hypothetical protein